MRSRIVSVVVVVVLVAGLGLAGWRVRGVLDPAEAGTTILFNRGLEPTVTEAPSGWTNRWCGSCHNREYEQWLGSRHNVAATAHNFEVECLEPVGGRQQYCLNCHAPRIPANGLPTSEPPGLDEAFREYPDWLAAGVDCLSCHVRDGVVVATNVTDKGIAKHAMRQDAALGKAEFCAGCHQFAFKDMDLPDHFHGALQQESFEEFLEYRAGGGVETKCQDCHMPHGAHWMPGGYDDEMVRQAVEMDLEARWIEPGRVAEVTVSLRAGRVGHRVPGGEELRFLTVRTEVTQADGQPVGTRLAADDAAVRVEAGEEGDLAEWPIVETLRRQMGDREHGRNLQAPPAPDTRLRPRETRRYTYRIAFHSPATTSLTIRSSLWYHLMHDGKAKLFGHLAQDVQRVVRESEVHLQPPKPVTTDR
ncbi:MAG: multiheme c-type cytochrome [Planctomycetaceae bacterium]